MKCRKCGADIKDDSDKCIYCGETINGDNRILVKSDYPHSLMMNIRKITKKDGIKVLKDSSFLRLYKEEYPDKNDDYKLLEQAYQLDIPQQFFKEKNTSDWSKRVFISQSLYKLVQYMPEKQAVILIESLMCAFYWDFSLYVERKWKVSEKDRSDFHGYDREKAKKASDELIYKTQNRTVDEEKNLNRERNKRKIKKEKKIALQYSNAHDIIDADNSESNDIIKRGNIISQKTEDIRKNKESIEKKDFYQEVQSHKVIHYEQMNLKMRKDVKKAKAGDNNSQQRLGEFYSEEGTKHLNYNEAVYWYKLSAVRGNYKAQMELGRIYDTGKIEVANSKQLGFEYYHKLACQGFSTAQCILGLKYLWGDGVKENQIEARKWLDKAAAQGNEEAKKYFINMF